VSFFEPYDPMYRDPQRNFSRWQREVIYKNDHGICGLCKKRVKGTWHCDHKIPWTLGGPTTIENGQVTHPSCNRSKYNDPNYEDIGWNRNWRAWWELIRN